MTAICSRLKSFLDEKGVAYQSIPHMPDFTSQETAAHTGTRGKEFAKSVVLRADGRFILCVLPAPHRIDFARFRRDLPASDVRLATEDEMEQLFPDCEVGAEPPFGALYGLPVVVSRALEGDEHITFNGGNHADVVRMKFADYRKLVQPRVMDFTVAPKP
jgi:Ala-tRNA(Pro) deacylase